MFDYCTGKIKVLTKLTQEEDQALLLIHGPLQAVTLFCFFVLT